MSAPHAEPCRPGCQFAFSAEAKTLSGRACAGGEAVSTARRCSTLYRGRRRPRALSPSDSYARDHIQPLVINCCRVLWCTRRAARYTRYSSLLRPPGRTKILSSLLYIAYTRADDQRETLRSSRRRIHYEFPDGIAL